MKTFKELTNGLMVRKTDNVLVQLFRYFIVSGLSLVIDFCTLFVLTDVMHVQYLVSGVLSYSIGLVINYHISVNWVFNSRNYDDRRKEFLIFAGIGVLGLGVNTLVLWICTGLFGLHYLASRVISAAIGYAWKYVARRAVLFRTKRSVLP